jgi:hypothetical protein
MTNSPGSSPLSNRIEHLITLLERVLETEDTSDPDRLNQLLSDLSRIDRSLAQIADTMSQMVPLMSDQTPAEEFGAFEANLTAALQIIIDRQKGLGAEMAALRGTSL